LGLGEEVGELFHAHLKEEQNIRGESNAHQLEAKDAVGDIIIYLMHYCTLRDWAIEPILNNVWEQTVSKRDWKKNPQEG
jgi:NTP pyrophosphatase (non-canonical NTP hydrolase)